MTKSLPSEAERIIVGKVGAPHGVKGEVKIIPLTDFPERFSSMKEITVGDDVFAVTGHRTATGGNPILKLAGIDNRDDAARLTGKMLTVSRKETMPLREGEYYAFDIVGLSVFDESGTYIGKVETVLKTGSNDVYVVKADSGKEILIPALKKIVTAIDIDGGKMTVNLPAEETDDAD